MIIEKPYNPVAGWIQGYYETESYQEENHL